MEFMKRAGRFLGLDRLVFPKTRGTNLQLPTKVTDVLEDVWELRNAIVHGNNPREGSLASQCLLSTFGTLRKVFVENLVDSVKDKKTWKSKLTCWDPTGAPTLKT